MVNDPSRIASERAPYHSPRRDPVQPTMSSWELAAHCLMEIEHHRLVEPYTDEFGFELLCRATIQGDQEARVWMQRCYGGMVLDWLYCHPCSTAACRLESEANFVARAFERFWVATALTQNVEFTTLAAALQYLRACLNGAILNTLRIYALSRELLLPEAGEPRKPHVEETTESSEVWEILQTMLPDEREKRLAYLSFHCGLGPREIMRFCPREFSDLHEIYHLRRSIMEQVLCNDDQLRWRLS
jgi:hypothetical protein